MTEATTETRRTETAFHEAGHVVAYLMWGIPFSAATIVPADEHLLGLVAPSPGPVRMTFAGPFLSFAGPWAQARAAWPTGLPVDSDEGEFSFDDYLTSAFLAGDQRDFDECGSYGQDAHDLRAGELEREWPAGCAVAEALLDLETITHDKAEALTADLLWRSR